MAMLTLLLVSLQALGALVGAGAAVWGELSYIRAVREGKIDRPERAHLERIALGLRFGMLLLLVSSLGLIISSYLLNVAAPPVLTPEYWTLIFLALLVVWASWALSRGRVTFSYGSAIVFSGWWFLVYLTFGWFPHLSFGAAVASFVIITAVFYALLKTTRHFATRTRTAS